MIARGQFHRIELSRSQIDRFNRLRRLDQLKKMDPVEFEQYVGFLYEKQGYKAHMTATSGDEGIDLLLTKGRSMSVVQCKRYAGTVGQPTVRDLYGTMLHVQASSAALVTTGNISRAAETWAVNKPIDLIDGHDLVSWISRDRRAAGPVGWVSNNLGKLALLVGVLIALGICLVSTSFAVRTIQERTDAQSATTDGSVLVVPTSPLTPAPTDVPADDEDEPTDDVTPTPEDQDELELAPTVTLQPTKTPPPGIVSADFAMPYAEDEIPLSTDAAFWEGVEGVFSTHIVEQDDTWDGSMDVSAAWRLAWDERYLYGHVTIEDNVLSVQDNARQGYLGDSLELEIDTLGDEASGAQADDYQYIITAGNFSDIPAGIFRFRGGSGVMADDWGTNAQVVSERLTGGYVIAFRIPWFDVRLSGGPQAGQTMGIALNVNDNDTPGQPVQELMISNVSTRRWSSPASWGSVEFSE